MSDVGASHAEPPTPGATELSLRRSFTAAAHATLQSPLKTSVLALGAVLAGFSLVVAVGVILLPWVLSALSAHQLQKARGRLRVPWRVRGWLFGFEALGFLLFASLCALAMLSWGLPAPEPEGSLRYRLATEALWRSPAALLAAALLAPLRELWMWAPTALLDGAAGPADALQRAADLAARAPRRRARLLSMAAPLLPVWTAFVLAFVTLWGEASGVRPYRVPLLVIGVSVAVALARGWVTSSYLTLCPQPCPARPPVGSHLSLRWVGPAPLLVLGPVLALFSILPPSIPAPGSAPPGARRLGVLEAQEAGHGLPLSGTSLLVQLRPRAVSVVAADGGGAGAIPLPPGEVSRVVVAQHGATYWLQIHADGQPVRAVPFDAEGVRLDDRYTQRFARRCPLWAFLLLALGVLAHGLLLGLDVRRVAGLSPPGTRALARLVALGPWASALLVFALGVATLAR